MTWKFVAFDHHLLIFHHALSLAVIILLCFCEFSFFRFHIYVQFSSVAQSCPSPCNPMDCSLPGSSVYHGILQARIVEWVAISFSTGSSKPRGWTLGSCIEGRFFTNWASREAWSGYTHGEGAHEKMFNSTSQLGNANQDHIEISLHTNSKR